MSSQTYFKRKIFNWLEEANFFNKQAVCIFIYLILSMSFLPGLHRLCISFLYVNLKTDDFSTFCLGCNIHITLVLIALGLSRIQNYCTFPITVYTLFQTFETKWKFTKMEMWYSYNLLVKAQCDQKKKKHYKRIKMGHFPNCWEKFIAQKDDVPAAVYIFTHQYFTFSSLKSTVDKRWTWKDKEEVALPCCV